MVADPFKNIPIFGAPPAYTPEADLNKRVYHNLWGNFSEFDGSVVDRHSKLINARFTIGTPHRSLKEDIDKAKSLVGGDLEAAGNTDSRLLNSFIFSEPVENGENTYLKIVDNLLEYMAYGVSNMMPGNIGGPTEGGINPYLDPTLRPFKSGSLQDDFPQFSVIASEETSVSETISNEVGDSFLANMLNFASNTIRDMNFITGGNFMSNSLTQAESGLREDDGGGDNVIADALASANEWLEKSKGFASKIVGEDVVTVIAEGSQLILPKVWKGSSFTKRYNITIRLNSPFGDIFSIANCVTIPLAHIMAAAFPIQTARNAVNFPFLVQIDAPGMMNVRMGIITNITLTKGGRDGVWSSLNGLPRSVDVNLEIADLYEILPGVKEKEHHVDYHNTTRDFVANIAGGVNSNNNQAIVAAMKSINENAMINSGQMSMDDILMKQIAVDQQNRASMPQQTSKKDPVVEKNKDKTKKELSIYPNLALQFPGLG